MTANSDEIPRIGRIPNPAEHVLQVVRENPEVLDEVGRNLFGHETDAGMAKYERWNVMPETDKETWRRKALEKIEQFAATYIPESL